MLMKQKLLLLLGALLLTAGTAWGVAPNSQVSFRMNGNDIHPSFHQFSQAVPSPLDLGVVYASSAGVDSPNLGVIGYQVVIPKDREGIEYETSHYMLVYIGVYDSNIASTGVYYDSEDDKLKLWPTTSAVPVPFGTMYWGGSGGLEPMNEVMYAESFIAEDGEVLDFVLPNPLVYDETSHSYKTGKYQIGHSYVVAIHFKEVSQWTIDNTSGTSDWHYPQLSNEYGSYLWNDHKKECLLASFNYQTHEGSGPANVTLKVNGEDKYFGLLGSGQDPIELGKVYKDEATNLPSLGFVAYGFESSAPYTVNLDEYGMNYCTMVYTVYKKDGEIAGQINENHDVDYSDYKTGDFGWVTVGGGNTRLHCINCFNPENPAHLSEDWSWGDWQMEANLYPEYSHQHPVLAVWGLAEDYTGGSPGCFLDGEAYTIALYFAEYIDFYTGIHRNGGKYYKFNFTYSKDPVPSGISNVTTDRQRGGKWYTLDGREVTSPARGLYIRDGRKVVVR